MQIIQTLLRCRASSVLISLGEIQSKIDFRGLGELTPSALRNVTSLLEFMLLKIIYLQLANWSISCDVSSLLHASDFVGVPQPSVDKGYESLVSRYQEDISLANLANSTGHRMPHSM